MDGMRLADEGRVKRLKEELQGDMYRDAERKHKEMLITLRVSNQLLGG